MSEGVNRFQLKDGQNGKIHNRGKSGLAIRNRLVYTSQIFDAGVAELVDARDSKSRIFDVSVRFRPPVPSDIFKKNHQIFKSIIWCV